MFKDILKTVDKANQTLLNLTAPTDDEENKIGAALKEKIVKENKVTQHTKYDVKRVFERVKKNVTRTKIKYDITIFKNKDVNAYAIAGGKTFILTGLLDMVESEEELAFVIAHEIAHNELKHCIKKVQYACTAGSINPLFGEVVQAAYGIYSIPFTKDEEFAADERGLMLLKKSGYGRQGAIRFFEKLEQLEKKYGIEKRDAFNDFISSHPTANARKKKIESMN